MDNKKVISYIVKWIKDYVHNGSSNIDSLVVGVSGGIDSALTSTLCAMTGINTILVKIPIKSNDIGLSRLHCEALKSQYENVKIFEICLSDIFDSYKNKCLQYDLSDDLGFANSKSRMRMMLLYQFASKYSGIVVGTGNKVEDFGVGFYTKYGDGGVDISPIADLKKSQVKSLAKELNIIEPILNAAPSDGLWEDDRTDEQQLGLSYEEIEEAMENIQSVNRDKYEKIRKKNLHKMEPIPVCFIKDKS